MARDSKLPPPVAGNLPPPPGEQSRPNVLAQSTLETLDFLKRSGGLTAAQELEVRKILEAQKQEFQATLATQSKQFDEKLSTQKKELEDKTKSARNLAIAILAFLGLTTAAGGWKIYESAKNAAVETVTKNPDAVAEKIVGRPDFVARVSQILEKSTGIGGLFFLPYDKMLALKNSASANDELLAPTEKIDLDRADPKFQLIPSSARGVLLKIWLGTNSADISAGSSVYCTDQFGNDGRALAHDRKNGVTNQTSRPISGIIMCPLMEKKRVFELKVEPTGQLPANPRRSIVEWRATVIGHY